MLTGYANDGMIAQITEQFAHLHDLDSGAVPIPAVLPSLAGKPGRIRPAAWTRFASSDVDPLHLPMHFPLQMLRLKRLLSMHPSVRLR